MPHSASHPPPPVHDDAPGYRLVFYEYCISLVFITLRRPSRLVRLAPGSSGVVEGLPYTLLTLVGSAVWAFALAGIGYGLGTSYHCFDHAFKYAEYAVVAGIVLGMA